VDKFVSNHDLVKQTSEISGVNERSIYRILIEYRDSHKITQPEGKRNRPDIIQKVVNFDQSAIRKIVHIKKFREENRRIFYTDETWVNAGN
jgi:hypothetical protein